MVSAELDNEDRPRDEIADCKDLRYVCKEYIYSIIFLFYRSVGSCEAMWHLRGYPISRRYPSVQVIQSKLLLSSKLTFFRFYGSTRRRNSKLYLRRGMKI